MRRLPVFAAAVALSSFSLSNRAARADVVVLKDGTRIEGELERTDEGYNVSTADGRSLKVKSTQIKSVEVKAAATPDDARRRLESLRRSAENMSDLKVIINRYNDFLRRYGATPQADEARQDLLAWEDKLERHMTKAGGKWVTPEELGTLQEQSQSVAARARDHIAQNRLREAGPLLQQALDVDPKNPSALYLRGVVQYRQDQLGPARKTFETVGQLVKDHAPTLNNLAVIYWRQQNYAAALKNFDAAMLAAGSEGGVAEGVLNNVAEALHALPKDQRNVALTKRVVLHFQEREEAMGKGMGKRGLFRWGSSWVEAGQLDKLQAKEKEIEDRIKDLEKEFEAVQARIDEVDRDIQDTERTLRRIEATSYVRDPVTGRTATAAPPRMYYGLQRDLQELKKERADHEAKVNGLRREAKLVKQELPVPRYTGAQKIIDAEGAPLMPAMEPASPAPAEPAAG
jgi:tetratricopeptide (TPR) repeat protein